MDRSVTRNDVAKRAGVSPALVSYVINNTKPVSDEKRAAVLRAIEELHYSPNLNARGLRTNQSMQIAFVCDNLRNDWLEIAESLFTEQGYSVSHRYSNDQPDFIRRLIEERFDGVFMLSNRYVAEQLNQIASAGIPVVLYKTRDYSYLGPNIATVAPDIYDAVRKTVNYLIVRGHKRIILAPPLRYNMNLGKGYRERAYKEALEENGIEYDESLVCMNTDSLNDIYDTIFDRMFSGRAADRPTAVVAGNDYIAAHIIQYLKSLNFKVPEEVAVVGMDNTYLAELLTPQLTSVTFSKEEFSQQLVNSMLTMIRGGKPEDVFIDVALAVRDSA